MRKIGQLASIVTLFFAVSEIGDGSFYVGNLHCLCLMSAITFLIMYLVERFMDYLVYLTELVFDSERYVLGFGLGFEMIALSVMMYIFSSVSWNVSVTGIFTYFIMSLVLVVIHYLCLDENPYMYYDYSVWGDDQSEM